MTVRSQTGRLALLAAIGSLGAIARLGHIFNFYVYPDSYYYLLIADNLRRHKVVYGRLGAQGMHFPPVGPALFKPIYPLFVALADSVIDNLEISGHAVALGASLMAILVAYFLVKQLFASTVAALIAAFLMAASYNYTFWSGFIMGDSLSVLLLMLGLLLVLRRDEPAMGNILDGVAGVALGLALLSRLTYAALLPALLWLMITEFGWNKGRLLTFFSGLLLTVSLTAVLFFPPAGRLPKLFAQFSVILAVVMAVLITAAASIVVARARFTWRWAGWLTGASWLALSLLIAAPAILEGANLIMSLFGGRPVYRALELFVAYDPLLTGAYLAGVYLMARSGYRRLALFCSLGVTMLLVLYYQVETWEFRYLIHMMPFLVVPAAYALAGAYGFLRNWLVTPANGRVRAAVAISGLLLLTTAAAATAGKAATPSRTTWLQTSYPREVSRLAAPALAQYPKRTTILITALPWPYHFHLKFSTWGIGAHEPGKLLRFLPRSNRFLVVSDMSLRYHFPSVAERLSAWYSKRAIVSFAVRRPYQYAYVTVPEEHEVRIYELSQTQVRRLFRNLPK